MSRLLKTLALALPIMLIATSLQGQPELPEQAFDIFDVHKKPIDISLNEAIIMALDNNISLRIEKLNVDAKETDITAQDAAFDTKVKGKVGGTDRKSQSLSPTKALVDQKSERNYAEIGIERLLHSGTTVGLNLSADKGNGLYSERIALQLLRPMKRGGSREVNLVALNKAKVDHNYSEAELKGFILNFIASVENKYWEHYMSIKQLDIVTESATLALQQRKETISRIRAGSIPESERAAADAEVAKCEEDMINAQSNVVITAIALLRAVNNDRENFWRTKPRLLDKPFLHKIDQLDLEAHLALAEKQRPELQQARLLIEKDQLEIVASRDGLLPKLDFFLTLGNSGYADTFRKSHPRVNSEEKLDFEAGISYELMRRRRAATARLEKAKITKEMKVEALNNLEQIIKEDVIKAYIEIQRAMRQVSATAATTEKQKEKLRVEEIKFSVGKTTSFQVSQAQRDLTEAKIAEVKAAIAYTKAITELMRADGSSLLKANSLTLYSSLTSDL
jgi:outer membrane protein